MIDVDDFLEFWWVWIIGAALIGCGIIAIPFLTDLSLQMESDVNNERIQPIKNETDTVSSQPRPALNLNIDWVNNIQDSLNKIKDNAAGSKSK